MRSAIPCRAVVLRCLLLTSGLWIAQLPAVEAQEDGAVIRVLSPAERLVSGRVEIETLSIDPEIRRVVFLLDGEEIGKRNRPPYSAKVPFASPPKEQTLEVKAYGARDRLLGGDSLVINRLPIPFRSRISALAGDPTAGSLQVEAEVSVPRKAQLDKVDFFLGEELQKTLKAPPFTAELTVAEPRDGEFVRVVATLEDGRAVEDVQVVGAGLSEQVDVNLVQLQVLAVKKNGAPVDDLTIDDFEVLENGKQRKIDRLYPAEDVSLVLGLVLDSSGSMAPIWDLTTRSATQFLQRVVKPRDRAFLVDFDTSLNLAQSLTSDLEDITEAMGEIVPEGGTALYDSVLFSLLQFTDEPGRRALVVLTDGVDAGSMSHPKRAVEFGRKLGVPVYIVALPGPGRGMQRGGAITRNYSVQELKLLTDPTGGRLIRAGSGDGIGRAFSQIDHELRHQYVLTYYTDELPDLGRGNPVKVRVKGRKDVEVRAVLASDQVN